MSRISNHIFQISVLLALFCFTLLTELAAQPIGGLAHEGFNPQDKGKNYLSEIFLKNATIYPSTDKHYFVLNREQSRPGYSGRLPGRIWHVLDSTHIQDFFPFYSWPDPMTFGEAIPMPNGKTAMVGFATEVVNQYVNRTKFDSINLVLYQGTGYYFSNNQVGFEIPKMMVIPNAFAGNYRFGLEQVSANRFYFYLSYNLDSTATHNKVAVYELDSTMTPTGLQHTVNNFLLEKGSVNPAGQLVLLGRQMTGTQPGNTQLIRFDQNLSPASNAFPALPANLINGRVGVFHFLPNGKVQLAGPLLLSNQSRHALVQLNADGGLDGGFPTYTLPANAIEPVWDKKLGSTLVRVAWQETTSSNRYVCKLAEINQSGVVQRQAAFSPPSNYPMGKPLMFHPGYDAFLFETSEVFGWSNYIGQSGADPAPRFFWLPPSVFRFWVNFSSQQNPLADCDGLVQAPTTLGFTINRSSERGNQFLSSHRQIQYNRQLSPLYTIIDANGQADTTFKGIHTFPAALRARLTAPFDDQGNSFTTSNFGLSLVANKKLLVGVMGTSLTSFTDTIRRIDFAGNMDPSFVPYRCSRMIHLRNKNMAGLRFTHQDGRPALPIDSNGRIVTTVMLIDSLGNFIRDIATINAIPGLDDNQSSAPYRLRNLLNEDNRGGIWVYMSTTRFVQGVQTTVAGYFRIMPNGSTRFYSFRDSSGARITDSFVRVRAFQNRFSLLTNRVEPVTGEVTNEFIADTTGLIVEQKSFEIPDGFGARNNGQLRFFRILPDGKLLFQLITQLPHRGSLYLRYLANGTFDPSFMPIETGGMNNLLWATHIFNDKLLIFNNSNLVRYERLGSTLNQKMKNGLYAFNLNSLPDNLGFVQGKVEQVPNPASGCNPVGTRTPTPFSLVRSAPGGQVTLTNQDGFYTIAALPGAHAVRQDLFNDALRRQICPVGISTPLQTSLAAAGDVSLNNNFINQTFNCARLTMRLLQPRFRLCAKNRFQIFYKNEGTDAEPNARIKLSLPQLVKIWEASSPFVVQQDSSVVFSIGNLAPGQSGIINIADTIGCPATPDSNARACFSARMEPVSACSQVDPPSIGWDGSWLDGKAKYDAQQNKVRFTLYNRGANMTEKTRMHLGFFGTTLYADSIQLAAGDSISWLADPVTERFLGLHVQQPRNCPVGRFGHIVHTGQTQATFYLNFEDGWLMNQTATACPVFRYSYDPNEKVVEPVDPVSPGTELSYTIHFENFGNDTAYTVIIADTLPPGVDISTFRMVGASHTCTPRLDGTENNPVIFFNFIPIKLTAKREDSIRSKGQVDFKIRLRPNVELGSEHRNTAHIYFDRNPAIITNTVVTKVREPIFPVGTPAVVVEQKGLMAYPNPATDELNIVLPPGRKQADVQLLNLQGQVLLEAKANRLHKLNVGHLSTGMYVVKVQGLKPVTVIIDQK